MEEHAPSFPFLGDETDASVQLGWQREDRSGEKLARELPCL